MDYRQFCLLVEQNNLMIELMAEIACANRSGGGPPREFYMEKVRAFESTLKHLDPDSGRQE